MSRYFASGLEWIMVPSIVTHASTHGEVVRIKTYLDFSNRASCRCKLLFSSDEKPLQFSCICCGLLVLDSIENIISEI